MRVTRAIPFDLYWAEFPEKRPSAHPRGDNIYQPDPRTKFVQVPNRSHGPEAAVRDLKANRVLISTHFYYFGRGAPALPAEFGCLLATTQGHRRIRPGSKRHPQFLAIVAWLESQFECGQLDEPELEDIICLPPEEDETELDD
jgi:hypothetical protein